MTNKQAWKLIGLILFNQASWASAVYLANRYVAKLQKEKQELYDVGMLVFQAIEDAGRLDLINENPKLQEYLFNREFSKLTESYYEEN